MAAKYSVRPLDETTWHDFARLVERHNGVWGGCWCMSFHPEGIGKGRTSAQNRSDKECRVRERRAHAALAFDGELCVGWCQFGSPDELSRIKHRREYNEQSGTPPDWRITCFFVDKAYRGKGVAARALEGALGLIAELGGGMVESYPEAVENRSVPGAFLYGGTVAMFERQGFARTRPLGKNHWVVTKFVAGSLFARGPSVMPSTDVADEQGDVRGANAGNA